MAAFRHASQGVTVRNFWLWRVTATIELKTKQKKAFTTFFAEGNTTDT